MSVTGIILAGGKSSRMGTDKAQMLLNGKPLIEYIINTFQNAGIQNIIINTNKKADFLKYNLPICEDIYEDKGPISGVYSSLLMSTTDENVIIPCDSPFVSSKIILDLIEQNRQNKISFLRFKNNYYPLIGAYKKETNILLKKMIENNELKMKNLILNNGTSILDLTNNYKDVNKIEIELANLNTIRELDLYENRM